MRDRLISARQTDIQSRRDTRRAFLTTRVVVGPSSA
jgi:hypothetical protein